MKTILNDWSSILIYSYAQLWNLGGWNTGCPKKRCPSQQLKNSLRLRFPTWLLMCYHALACLEEEAWFLSIRNQFIKHVHFAEKHWTCFKLLIGRCVSSRMVLLFQNAMGKRFLKFQVTRLFKAPVAYQPCYYPIIGCNLHVTWAALCS